MIKINYIKPIILILYIFIHLSLFLLFLLLFRCIELSDHSIIFNNDTVSDLVKTDLNLDRVTNKNLNDYISQIPDAFNNMNGTDYINIKDSCKILGSEEFNRMKFSVSNIITTKRNDIFDNFTGMLFEDSRSLSGVNCNAGKLLRSHFSFKRTSIQKDFILKKIANLKEESSAYMTPDFSDFSYSTQDKSAIENIINISNSTCISRNFESSQNKFNDLFKKRAFVHSFVGDGMDEMEFTEAEDNVKDLISLYVEMENKE